MHSLEQLRSGALAGLHRLDLSAELQEFPREIFDLADTLEVLNLSANQLRTLPHDLPRLKQLKVLFCSDNPFTELPEVLGDCPQLEMVGFKSNQLQRVSAASLPDALRWLILTDNQIRHLPDALGERPRLQKLMLAGNRLSRLPASMANLANLELLRLAANDLEALPCWLLKLPRLSWLAFAGNPVSTRSQQIALNGAAPVTIDRQHVELGPLLGQGASGMIHRAQWQRPAQPPQPMAAKLFKGTITSDGLPHDEMLATLAAGKHPNLISVAGALSPAAGQPDGLLLELIEPSFSVLAGPPSLASCTRDTYSAAQHFSLEQLLSIATSVASTVAHLHARGIAHGDLYAHNLLVNARGECLLGDFGAATFFAPNSREANSLERVETRAFGCLLEELLERCTDAGLEPLWQLQQRCVQPCVNERPDFAEITASLRQ